MTSKATQIIIVAAVLTIGLLHPERLVTKLTVSQEPESEAAGPAVAPEQLSENLESASIHEISPESADSASEPASLGQTTSAPEVPGSQAADDDVRDSLALTLERIDDHLAAGDPVSLRNISDYLRDSRKEVRFAALEALREAGDRSMIADVEMAANESIDAEERAELAALADYLALPTLSELKSAGVILGQPSTITQFGSKYRQKRPGAM